MPTDAACRCFARASGRETIADPHRRIAADRANVRAALRRGRRQQIGGCVRECFTRHRASLPRYVSEAISSCRIHSQRSLICFRPLPATQHSAPGPHSTRMSASILPLSPDKKAFTALFGGLEAIIDGNSAPPIVTRSLLLLHPAERHQARAGNSVLRFGLCHCRKGRERPPDIHRQRPVDGCLPAGQVAGGLRPSAPTTRLRTRRRPRLPFSCLQTGIRNRTRPSI